jgi:hypothetical protein
MSEPGATGFLILRADVVPEVHVHDGQFLVLMQDDLQTVIEAVLFKRDMQRQLSQTKVLLTASYLS